MGLKGLRCFTQGMIDTAKTLRCLAEGMRGYFQGLRKGLLQPKACHGAENEPIVPYQQSEQQKNTFFSLHKGWSFLQIERSSLSYFHAFKALMPWSQFVPIIPHGLFVSVPCLMLSRTSSFPGLASSYSFCLVSGPPGPSKSRALVGLKWRQRKPLPNSLVPLTQ